MRKRSQNKVEIRAKKNISQKLELTPVYFKKGASTKNHSARISIREYKPKVSPRHISCRRTGGLSQKRSTGRRVRALSHTCPRPDWLSHAKKMARNQGSHKDTQKKCSHLKRGKHRNKTSCSQAFLGDPKKGGGQLASSGPEKAASGISWTG